MDRIADLLRHGYQFGPPMPTPRTRAGLPESEMRGASLPTTAEMLVDYGSMPAKGVVSQAQRAGQSVSDAIGDPTLANVTDAAVQSGLALSPASPIAGLVAAGAGGLGVLEALRRDYAPSIAGGEAEAKPKLKGTVQEDLAPPPDDDSLDPSQRKRLTDLQRKQARGESLSRAEREEQNTYLQTLQQVATTKAQAKTTASAEADASRRKTAETAYDTEKARDKRFQDTETGKVFAKLGPVAPGVVAAMVGGAAQLPRTLGWAPKGAMNVVTHPITEGTAAGVASAHWPQVYDANYAPTMNPSYAAMQAYIVEAPQGDERAARYRKLIEDKVVSPENPVRDVASKDLYDPTKFSERSALGLIEGLPGSALGSAVVKSVPLLARETVKGVASVPGVIREGYETGMEGAAKAAGARQAAEIEAQVKRGLAAEAQGVADEAARRTGGRTGGAGQGAGRAAGDVIGDPPPPKGQQRVHVDEPSRQTRKPPSSDAGTVKEIPPPRKTVTKEDTDQILRNLVAGKPAGEGLAGYSPQAITERADYLQKLAGTLGTPIDKLLDAGKLKKGPWSIAIGGAVGAGAAPQYEDDTSPTGYRDESGRFAKGGSSLDDAISKAMGGAP